MNSNKKMLASRRRHQAADVEPDFSGSSLVSLCGGITLILQELARRGIHVRDFDHKEKVVAAVRLYGNNVYFMSVTEDIVPAEEECR